MRASCYEIDKTAEFCEIDLELGFDRWRRGEGPFLVELEGASSEERSEVLSRVGVDPSLIETCLDSGHAARMLPLDGLVFFEFPVQPAADSKAISMAHVCLDRLVIAIHDRPLDRATGEERAIMPRLALQEPTSSELVCLLLIIHSISSRRRVIDLREAARRLSETLDQDPKNIELDQIMDLKHRILELDRTIDEQVAVFDLLGSMQTPELDLVRLATYFRIAKGNIAAADRGMDRLDRQGVDLQRVYDAFLQNRTNRRLGRLTVISAIFLPLTLIAGIYGMNFDVMPELGFAYAYPLTLGAMLVLGIGAYFWFRSRGWMD